MTFSEFCSTLESIEKTTLRNLITQHLAQLFKNLQTVEIEPACWLLLGRVFPPYEGIEFQFAEKMMIRAIASAFEVKSDDVVRSYKKTGDLGETVGTIVGAKKGKSLDIHKIYETLHDLCLETGLGSQERKQSIVIQLLQSVDCIEAKYIVRIILSKLRLGFSDMTILDALSWAVYGDKHARTVLEDAYQNKHDIGKLAHAFLVHHEDGIKHFEIELGVPIQPALCQRLKSPIEMIKKMGKVIVEPKYDGTRVQIHMRLRGKDENTWSVRTFTRSLEESSAMFPELVSALKGIDADSVILDCEAVGYDPKTGKLLPFQETIQRKRKHNVALFSQQIPLRFFVFDILYLNGKNLLSHPLFERKEILHKLFSSLQNEIFIESSYIMTDSPDELRQFHKKQLDLGLEGAVVKQYESVYQPGRKGFNWVKFKEEETSEGKLSDTIDAVVMGYWLGKGKRTSFGIGAFLIGIAGKNETIVTLSKVGTGLSDIQWEELYRRCQQSKSDEKPREYEVHKSLFPDFWVKPTIIVEVAGDELTKSPTHSAGLALRFPRLVRFREDKKVDQITTVKELAQIG